VGAQRLTSGHVYAFYNQGFAKRHVWARMSAYRPGQLWVYTWTDFTDPVRREAVMKPSGALALVVSLAAGTLACAPRPPARTSFMLEDEQHEATAEDRAIAEGKARPFPDEPPASGENGRPASLMLDDLEAARASEPAGPRTLEEPRRGRK
jgi:hypothetical protein